MVESKEPLLPPSETSARSSSSNTINDRSLSCNKVFWRILWIILLIWVAWPVAMFAASFWLGLQPFEALIDVLQIVNRLLEQVVTWPRGFGKAIANGDENLPPICNYDRAQDSAEAQNDLDLELPTADTHCQRLLCTVLWLFLLIYVAWPVAGFVSALWIFLQPFEAFMGTGSGGDERLISVGLQRLTTWPRACGHGTYIKQATCFCRFTEFFLRLIYDSYSFTTAMAIGQSTVPFPPSSP